MRQIGARQEAGRIGGIGPCGREMCCASWMTSFVSVSTHSARIQDLSLNPVKLAGQCGKLKCCLNYELSAYVDAIKSFPPTDKPLETAEGTYYFYKYDIFKRLMWYSPQKDSPTNIVAVEADHVAEIQSMNAQGQKPDILGLYNTCTVHHLEDVLYFTLQTIHLWHFRRESDELYLCGEREQADELLKMLTPYVPHISVLKPEEEFNANVAALLDKLPYDLVLLMLRAY